MPDQPSRQAQLETLNAAVRACTLCPLHRGRTKAVPGAGPVDAQIMLIGEGPGFHEDRQGLPFVGAAGQLLDELLAGIGILRAEVYITNVVKCRPPQNRDPLPAEITACGSYLDEQLALIKPRVVITLGRFSMARWFPNAKISAIHGRAKSIGGVLYIPMLHPAAALHQPAWREQLEEDFRKIPVYLQQAEAADEGPADEPPAAQQLSLF